MIKIAVAQLWVNDQEEALPSTPKGGLECHGRDLPNSGTSAG